MAKVSPISVRLEAPQREALERAAREQRRDLSELGRLVLADWLVEHGWLRTETADAA